MGQQGAFVSKMLDWRHAETILLDMDGTILDLSFDNYFWRELVPRCLARIHGLDSVTARAALFARYARKQGSLDWYCLDYWTRELELDLRALKAASSQRIRYLPGARNFLAAVAGRSHQLVLVTNAHAHTLEVKKGVAGLERYFERFVSAHELGCPKESLEFWPQLHSILGFDPEATLLVDDSLTVLDAAATFGIRGLVAVTRPDSRLPARSSGMHPGVEGIGAMLKHHPGAKRSLGATQSD